MHSKDREHSKRRGRPRGHVTQYSEGGTGPGVIEEVRDPSTAWDRSRALTQKLMEQVCDRANLNRAYRRVKTNRGAPGVDGMTVEELYGWLITHKRELIKSLLEGSYKPQSVRGIEIPKPGGGVRQLGIPTVVDRFVQQALGQVLDPLWDPTFSESSYGFRPKRSAHQALKSAQGYVREERRWVVDMDLEKFFDRVNHDILMSRVARWIGDKRILRILRRMLEAGMMRDGMEVERTEGTPQGGPLSPLLSNLLLDELDKELEQRGHSFCRYADDCNIYVRSQVAGERVMRSVSRFLQTRLRLKVNESKSAVARVEQRSFLGHRILRDGRLSVAPKSIRRMKVRVRQITRRTKGEHLGKVIRGLNTYLRGWVHYYRYAAIRTHSHAWDLWIQRRLRCYRLKQRKTTSSRARFFLGLGVSRGRAWTTAKVGRRWWILSGTPTAHKAMPLWFFDQLGLYSMHDQVLRWTSS